MASSVSSSVHEHVYENPSKPPMSPFANIPGELLSHIVTLVFQSHEEAASLAKYRLPSVLSRVSHLFYRTVQSTPALWSYIYMPSSSIDFAHLKDRINRRSGILPLEIHMYFVTNNDAVQEQVLDMLLTCSMRWRTLSSELYETEISWNSPRAFWNQLKRLLESPAPQLHSLSLENLDPHSELPLLRLDRITSPLRNLHLAICSYVWSGRDSLPPTLEELYVNDRQWHSVNPNHLIDSLRGPISHSLRRLSLSQFTLDCRPLNPDSFTFPEPNVLEALDFFEIRDMNVIEAVVLFTLLKAPNLRHLAVHIKPERIDGYRTTPKMLGLWESLRFPKLEAFTVGAIDAPGSLVGFLARLPGTVKYLNISRERLWAINSTLEGLMEPDAEPFRRGVEYLGVSGLRTMDVLELVAQFPALKALAVDIRDVVIHPDDAMAGKLKFEVDKLKDLPVKVDFIPRHDSHSSAICPVDPNNQSWEDLVRSKSYMLKK